MKPSILLSYKDLGQGNSDGSSVEILALAPIFTEQISYVFSRYAAKVQSALPQHIALPGDKFGFFALWASYNPHSVILHGPNTGQSASGLRTE